MWGYVRVYPRPVTWNENIVTDAPRVGGMRFANASYHRLQFDALSQRANHARGWRSLLATMRMRCRARANEVPLSDVVGGNTHWVAVWTDGFTNGLDETASTAYAAWAWREGVFAASRGFLSGTAYSEVAYVAVRDVAT